MPEVTVVIPNWNGKRFLEVCIPSIYQQEFRNFTIIVVDNGSQDESVNFLKKTYPEVEIIQFSENKGFSAAVNAGILKAKTDFVALLNNDTEADKKWLSELCNILGSHPEVGICASKMVNFYRRDIIDSVGDAYTRGGAAVKLGMRERDTGQYEEQNYVFGASAGAAIYRRELFYDIGLFDEDFFAYLEDIDISFRARLKGYQCLFVPSAVVYHIGSATTGSKLNSTTLFLTGKNSFNVLVKNMPTSLLIYNFGRILFNYFSHIVYYFLQGPKLGWAYLSGIVAGFSQIGLMLKKRREIQLAREIPVREISILIKKSEIMVRQFRLRRRSQGLN